MRFLLSIFLACTLLSAAGCDNVTIMGAINTGTFSGTVSVVRLTAGNDGTQITFVTLVNAGTSQDFDFCGNVVPQFPMNGIVQGSFTPGTTCKTIVRIVITG